MPTSLSSSVSFRSVELQRFDQLIVLSAFSRVLRQLKCRLFWFLCSKLKFEKSLDKKSASANKMHVAAVNPDLVIDSAGLSDIHEWKHYWH